MLSRVMEEPGESPPPAPGRSDSVNIIRNIVSRQAKIKVLLYNNIVFIKYHKQKQPLAKGKGQHSIPPKI